MANEIDFRRIPLIGDDLYQVGQVYSIVAQTCTPKPWITVNAFFAYAPKLAWSLVKPEVEDQLTNRFGRRHKKVRRRKFYINFLDSIDFSPKNFATKAIFGGFAVTERLGYYVLVVDATTDFLVNWTSMAYTFSGCPSGNAEWGWCQGGETFLDRAAGTVTVNAIAQQWDDFGAAFASATQVAINSIGPKSFMAKWRGYVKLWNGISGQITKVELIISSFGLPTRVIEMNQDTGAFDHGSWSIDDYNQFFDSPVQTYQVRITYTGGDLIQTNFEMSAVGAEAVGLSPDP